MITRLETTNFTIKNTIKPSLRFSPVFPVIRSFLRFLPVYFPVFPRQIAYPPHKNRKISLKETFKLYSNKI